MKLSKHEKQTMKDMSNAIWTRFKHSFRSASGIDSSATPDWEKKIYKQNSGFGSVEKKMIKRLKDKPVFQVDSSLVSAQKSASLHIFHIVRAAVEWAPLDRPTWSIRLRLRQDVIYECSMALEASHNSLNLRFCSSSLDSLMLLYYRNDEICRSLTNVLNKDVTINLTHDYFGRL